LAAKAVGDGKSLSGLTVIDGEGLSNPGFRSTMRGKMDKIAIGYVKMGKEKFNQMRKFF